MEATAVLLLEAVAALLLTLASALVILAVITADRWDEPEQQNERAKSAPWRKVA